MKSIFYLLSLLSTQLLTAQECINIDYMLRGYFHADSPIEDDQALGGYAGSSNVPKENSSAELNYAAESGLQLVVESDAEALYQNKHAGFRVYLINPTDTTVWLSAQDSRIDIRRQVLHNGEWQYVEYLPSSWCGNSYHMVALPAGHFWSFVAPCTDGKETAQFRFELSLNKGDAIYSSVFEGGFNEGQLTKEEGYNRRGLMDPYDD